MSYRRKLKNGKIKDKFLKTNLKYINNNQRK